MYGEFLGMEKNCQEGGMKRKREGDEGRGGKYWKGIFWEFSESKNERNCLESYEVRNKYKQLDKV